MTARRRTERGLHSRRRATRDRQEAFDASLRSRDPPWGVRDLNDVRSEAHGHDLVLADIAPMPANNMILIFEPLRYRRTATTST
jgi:hypothetical protein